MVGGGNGGVVEFLVVVTLWIIVKVVMVLCGANYCGAVGNYKCDGIRNSYGGGVGIETLMLGVVTEVG